jgi:hypothetical protein
VVKLPQESPEILVLETGFDDDSPADEAKITITDKSGAIIATGRTDEKGICRLTRPGAGFYRATVEAFGHRDSVEFEVKPQETNAAEVFAGARPNQTTGLILGVVGLLGVSTLFWMVGRRGCCRRRC